MHKPSPSLLVVAALGATLMLAPAAAASMTTPSPAVTAAPTLTPAPVPTVSIPPMLPAPTLTPEPVSEDCYPEGESPIVFTGGATSVVVDGRLEVTLPGGTPRECVTSWGYTIQVLVEGEWQSVAGDGSNDRVVPPLTDSRAIGGAEQAVRHVFRGFSGTAAGPDFVLAEFPLTATVDPTPAPVVPGPAPSVVAPAAAAGSAPSSTAVAVATTPRPAASTAGRTLASTGSDAGALLPIGAVALLAGAAAFVTARRRRRRVS